MPPEHGQLSPSDLPLEECRSRRPPLVARGSLVCVASSTGGPPALHSVVVTELAVQAPDTQICCPPQTFPQPPQLS